MSASTIHTTTPPIDVSLTSNQARASLTIVGLVIIIYRVTARLTAL
jgi:hypothetical protein